MREADETTVEPTTMVNGEEKEPILIKLFIFAIDVPSK
jgi:hypothetical protein